VLLIAACDEFLQCTRDSCLFGALAADRQGPFDQFGIDIEIGCHV